MHWFNKLHWFNVLNSKLSPPVASDLHLYLLSPFSPFYLELSPLLLTDIHQVRNEFHVTEKMSTYLVAFVICDFKTKQEFTKTNNITVKVAVAEDKLEQADFALKTATNITEYYEHYFGIPYPLPKQGKPTEVIMLHQSFSPSWHLIKSSSLSTLDLIAIPDFGAGAMENWGLITYRCFLKTP